MNSFIKVIKEYFFYLVNYKGKIYLLYDKEKNKYIVSFIYYKHLKNFEKVI